MSASSNTPGKGKITLDFRVNRWFGVSGSKNGELIVVKGRLLTIASASVINVFRFVVQLMAVMV